MGILMKVGETFGKVWEMLVEYGGLNKFGVE